MRGQELRAGVRFDHLLHGGGILVVIQPEIARILPHKALCEHTSGELLEAFVFDRLQKSRRDFQVTGDLLKLEVALLAFLAQALADGSHTGGLPRPLSLYYYGVFP